MATPVMLFIESIRIHFEHPEQVFTLADVYDNSLLYMMLLTNVMIYIAITAYLFSREYTEKTFKTIELCLEHFYQCLMTGIISQM